MRPLPSSAWCAWVWVWWWLCRSSTHAERNPGARSGGLPRVGPAEAGMPPDPQLHVRSGVLRGGGADSEGRESARNASSLSACSARAAGCAAVVRCPEAGVFIAQPRDTPLALPARAEPWIHTHSVRSVHLTAAALGYLAVPSVVLVVVPPPALHWGSQRSPGMGGRPAPCSAPHGRAVCRRPQHRSTGRLRMSRRRACLDNEPQLSGALAGHCVSGSRSPDWKGIVMPDCPVFYAPAGVRRPASPPWFWFTAIDMVYVRRVYRTLRRGGDSAADARRMVLVLAGCEVVR